MNLLKLIQSKLGRFIVSVILGLGLATLFRKSCKSKECTIFLAPNISSIKDDVYSFDSKCVKYKEKAVKCDNNHVVIKTDESN